MQTIIPFMNRREGSSQRSAITFPFDPIERSRLAEDACMRGPARRYHRFRAARYYGGIVTADAVGCSFLCAFCWNYDRNLDPARHGRFYSPDEVAVRMIGLARRTEYRLFRITGSEPVLGEASLAHVAAVIDGTRSRMPEASFVVETNGLMLGHDEALADRIPRVGVVVRVALKGIDEESFERISGARGEFFEYPLRAILALQERRIEVWPAIMEDLHRGEELRVLRRRMHAMGIRAQLETEVLERYPRVMEHIAERGTTVR